MERIVASTKSRLIVHKMVGADTVVMSLESDLLPIHLSKELPRVLII